MEQLALRAAFRSVTPKPARYRLVGRKSSIGLHTAWTPIMLNTIEVAASAQIATTLFSIAPHRNGRRMMRKARDKTAGRTAITTMPRNQTAKIAGLAINSAKPSTWPAIPLLLIS